MLARVNVLETTPDRIADVAQVVRDIVHPGIRGEDGYVGYVVLGDSHTGKAIGVTLWETEAALEASAERAHQLRSQAIQPSGATTNSVTHYEVALTAQGARSATA